MRLALILALLLASASAQSRSTVSILHDPKFLASTAAVAGATLFDEYATVNGGRACNGEVGNPHPTYGNLAAKDWGMVAGFTALKFVMMKAKVKFPFYLSADGVLIYKHLHGGLDWMNHC